MKRVLDAEHPAHYRNIDSAQCPGCPSNLAAKLVMQIVFEACREKGQDPIIFGQGCGIGRNFLSRSGIGTHDSACVALKAAMSVRGIDRPVVVIDGDGQLDMGLEDFSGAFQQGWPYLHIVADNQTYTASGNHGTGMTDLLTRVSTRPNGRVSYQGGQVARRKQPAMMIKFSGARYAATAAISHVNDFERKIRRALNNMPAFIQVLTPCNVAWGYNDDQGPAVTRLGVDCGIWPLWEWCGHEFRRTVPLQRGVMDQRLGEYLEIQRRYPRMTEEDLAHMREYIADLNQMVDRLAVAFPATGKDSRAPGGQP